MKPCVGRARPHHPRRRCRWACAALLERLPALDVSDVTVVRRQATIENKIEKRRMNHTQVNYPTPEGRGLAATGVSAVPPSGSVTSHGAHQTG